MKHDYDDDEDLVLFKQLIGKLEEKEIWNLKVSMSISKWEGTIFTLSNVSELISCQWTDSETISDFIDRTLYSITQNNGS